MDYELTPGTLLLLSGHVCVAVLCVWSFLRERREPGGKAQAWFWLVLVVPVILLGVHHATGLGALLTNTFRQEALVEGWYGDRRALQRMLARSILGVALGALVLLGWMLRRQWRRYLPAALALVFLTAFGALQLVSLHDIDARMHTRWLGASLQMWLNTAGLALAGGGLCWSYVQGRQLLRIRSVLRRQTRRV